MKITSHIPIRAKLVIIVLVFAILPMLVLTLVWYNTSVVQISAVVRQSLYLRAQEISDHLKSRQKQGQTAVTTETLEAIIGERSAALQPTNLPPEIIPSQREIIVLDAQGVVLYSAQRKWEGHTFQEALPRELADVLHDLLAGKTVPTSLLRAYEADRYFLLDNYWRIVLARHPGATPLTIFVIEKDTERGRLDSAALIVLAISVLLAIVATLLVYLIISGTTDSIRRVTRGAKAIAAGNLETNISVKTNDETRVLADAFNRMSSRLREMIARESEQKQFESFARLSAVLTHDLKNAILSLSFLVTNMERKFDREGFREDAMRTLADSVRNLKNLVTKLSDPRAQSTEERYEEELSPLVERVVFRTSERVGERYEVSVNLVPEIKAKVTASAIERVVENLIVNAVEAMPSGGKLTIKTYVADEQAIISVADTGKGMPPEFVRERLFHPFATTKSKGIGLGLYSCRDIVERHGGKIEVESQEGVGTEFKIVLPLASAASDKDTVPAKAAELVSQ